ncbi:bifunctional transcriptional activator/DNA repair enzyme AdaA [Paenibacillus sp. J2TS4]|uniref:bifunctional transcriptional activator/DNA repair enzyme AdaA n=1 Tax=Paenibacillus sp. J2TS4 TaxID=2807194 RepID=UPI001BCCA6A7|nr:bifunctional transcriptional activator/DNA repair enzyme AdaA [Paenibacillus sp. J2TS4]
MSEEKWRAIVQNDSSYDGKFYYAVKTTGIFCRPSCKSRVPNKDHVKIFTYAEEALSEGFRPCKRCKPDGMRLPDEEWVEQIAQWIEKNYTEAWTLDMLADKFHGSPYHLQRTFKRVMKMSPAEYIQQVRIAKAMDDLASTNKTITEVALAVGIPNAAHFATLFHKRTGLTPTNYRQRTALNADIQQRREDGGKDER